MTFLCLNSASIAAISFLPIPLPRADLLTAMANNSAKECRVRGSAERYFRVSSFSSKTTAVKREGEQKLAVELSSGQGPSDNKREH